MRRAREGEAATWAVRKETSSFARRVLPLEGYPEKVIIAIVADEGEGRLEKEKRRRCSSCAPWLSPHRYSAPTSACAFAKT